VGPFLTSDFKEICCITNKARPTIKHGLLSKSGSKHDYADLTKAKLNIYDGKELVKIRRNDLS